MTIEELQEELQKNRSRQQDAADALTELSYLIDGLSLLDHYEEDNALTLPEDSWEVNACQALREAAHDQIRSMIGAIETLLTGETRCVEM